MQTEFLDYSDGDETFEAFVACGESSEVKRPCVIVCHAWAGQTDLERQRAMVLAELGYVGFALDVYGKGLRGDPLGENSHLMQPLLDDRALLLRRLQAAVKAASLHRWVDRNRIAAIGYCFGGLCVLDIARSGDSVVKAVACFHGIFHPPGLQEQGLITSKVLILHVYDDPLATPAQMVSVADELTRAKADWQIHAYGNTVHAFTNKGANMPDRGVVYNEASDRRSWSAAKAFLSEVLD